MNQNEAQQKNNVKVPDLPNELLKDQYKHNAYLTSAVPPFLSTTECLVTEDTNSDPNFIRSTMYTIPTSEYSLEVTGIPLVLLLSPFSNKGAYNCVSEIETCKFCRSFYNCFTKKENSTAVCNICNKKAESVFSFDNMQYPSVEYTKTEYSSALGSKPSFAFVFDMNSINLIDQVLDTVLNICKDENFRFLYENVCFIVIDSGITLFENKNKKICIVKILSEIPYISQDILIKTGDEQAIESIIRYIKSLPPQNSVKSIDNILMLLKEATKKITAVKTAFFSNCVSNLNYESYLADFKNCSINLFMLNTPTDKTNTNSLEKIAFYTSGSIFKYAPDRIEGCKVDLWSIALSRSAFNLSISLKTSDNLVKKQTIASTLEDNLSVCRLNHMDCNTTISFELSLNGLSKNEKYVQFIINFTDYDGSRKVRILNHSFPAGTPQQVFSNMSLDSIFCALIKMNVSDFVVMDELLVRSLIFYRNKCSSSPSATQFVLPESIKCLPVLIQSFNKKTHPEKTKLINFSVEENLRYFYPRLFSLSEYAIGMKLSETRNLPLTINSIQDGDIYIMENSNSIYVYVSNNVDPALLSKLFQYSSDNKPEISTNADEESLLLSGVVNEIMEHYNKKMNVYVCFANESQYEYEFLSYMVEDAINNFQDYINYIFGLHFKVQKG
jgi:protein transport protein SEC24